MSYCVECGVKLGDTITVCPLCHTEVIHPNRKIPEGAKSPFPKQKGKVEAASTRELSIVFGVTLFTTAISCGVLNFFLLQKIMWSLPVIGICVLLWVFFMPATIWRNVSCYYAVLCDAVAVILYLLLIAYMADGIHWFLRIALPISLSVLILTEAYLLMCKRTNMSIIGGVLYFIIAAVLLCVSIEVTIDLYRHASVHLSWSAIVIVVGLVVSAALATILLRSELREKVRRRLDI